MTEFTDSLNHEWGHRQQLDEMGIVKFSVYVAIPSLTYNVLDRMNMSPYNDYYEAPWEHDADLHGGVVRSPDPNVISQRTAQSEFYFNYIEEYPINEWLVDELSRLRFGGGGGRY